MDFAKKELEKYGWTNGKGLGKNEDGISEPIKPKLKHSLTGVGYDPAADLKEHWWSKLYDKAASNLEVENENGNTKKIRRKSDEEFVITNSTWKIKKKKKETKSVEEYSEFFVKTVVIGVGGEETTRVRTSDSDSGDESDEKSTTKMTDEELFAACGGRTAHKGARHGLRALGKLARIEQQEQILLQQKKYKGYSHFDKQNQTSHESKTVEDMNLLSEEGIYKNKKKRCHSTSKKQIIIPDIKLTQKDCSNNEIDESSGKLSKRLKNKITDKDQSINQNENEKLLTRKLKKLKTKISQSINNDSIDKSQELNAIKCKKLKSKFYNKDLTYDKDDLNRNNEINTVTNQRNDLCGIQEFSTRKSKKLKAKFINTD